MFYVNLIETLDFLPSILLASSKCCPSLREKCPYSEFSWSICGKILPEKLRTRYRIYRPVIEYIWQVLQQYHSLHKILKILHIAQKICQRNLHKTITVFLFNVLNVLVYYLIVKKNIPKVCYYITNNMIYHNVKHFILNVMTYKCVLFSFHSFVYTDTSTSS